MHIQCTLMTLIPQGSTSNQCSSHVHDCWITSNLIFPFSPVVCGSLFRSLPYLKSYFCFKCLIIHPIRLCFFYYLSANIIFYASAQFMLLVRVSSWPHCFFTKLRLHILDSVFYHMTFPVIESGFMYKLLRFCFCSPCFHNVKPTHYYEFTTLLFQPLK